MLASEAPIEGEQRECYRAGLTALAAARVEFLVGGGFAMHQYLARWRSTKDLDLFIRADDVEPALAALEAAGFRVERTDPNWLAKGFRGGVLIDLIFSSYNGLFPVDDGWFGNGREARVMDVPARLVGPEEMLVSKAFVAARDRFDGSDIAWLIRTLGHRLDWERIERLMEQQWEVLLWQLIHYCYVFPCDVGQVPGELLVRLLARMQAEVQAEVQAGRPSTSQTCRGPMFDNIHYLTAVPPGAS